MTKHTKGNYWPAKACFYIYYRTNEEWDEKYERMKAIADEKEWVNE